MHIIVIIIYRYVITYIDGMNRYYTRFFSYIEYIISIAITCMVNYFWRILMTWYFFNCIVVIRYFITDTNNWLCISSFLQIY